MKKLLAWLRSKNITTHTVGLAIITFACLYDSTPELRNYIGTLFVGHPVVVTQLGTLLTNIAADRSWNDEAARKQLLTVFEAAGPTSDVAKQGRRRLSSLLFS